MTRSENTLTTDILVVGSAGAGLRAAIEASSGARVMVASKGPFGRGGATVMAGADIMLDGKSLSEMGFSGDPDDSQERFFQDILAEGFELNNQEMVEVYVREAPRRVKELLEWGMKIDPERSYRRAVLTTGREILRTLRQRFERDSIEVLEHFMATDLLLRDGVVCGAMGVDTYRGDILCIKCKAVILATGGWHELFSFNSGSDDLTGDGTAMAFRAGAWLSNMEMITFCPNIIVHPAAYRSSVFLYNLLPGKLLNSHGDEFLLWEDPLLLRVAQTTEWNKLILSRAIWREMKAGRGSPHGGVYYTLRHIPTSLWDALERSHRWKKGWRFQGKDFTSIIDQLRRGDAVEVAPAAHYFEGGIRVNVACETNIPGLFAAGECCGELFGANRVSAATTEMLVQGAIAGRSAAAYVKRNDVPEPRTTQIKGVEESLVRPLSTNSGVRAVEVKKAIQELAYKNLGPLRDGPGLQQVASESETFKAMLPRMAAPCRRSYNLSWMDALEARNLVDLLFIISLSALKRTESRGVHIRSDYPNVDNTKWLRNILVRSMEPSAPQIDTVPIVKTSHTPEPQIMSYDEAVRRFCSY